jgi:hypothetical protein
MTDTWGENDLLATDQPATDFGADDEVVQDGALSRGWNKAKQNMAISTDLALGDTEGAARTVGEAALYRQQNPGMQEGAELMQAWDEGDGIVGGVKAVAGEFSKDWNEADGFAAGARSVGKNLQAMGEGVLEQMGNMVAPVAGMVTGGVVGSKIGAPVGAAIGAPFAGVGAAPGAAIGGTVGGVAGAWAGASAGNAAIEGGGMAQEGLAQAGIDPTDLDAVKAYLDENRGELLKQASIKGGIIGAVDTATVGIAGRLLNGPTRAATARAMAALGVDGSDKAAVKSATQSQAFRDLLAQDAVFQSSRQGAERIARNMAAAAIYPAGEFAGEYVGTGVATGEWDTKNATLEALSSVGQSAAMYAGQKAYQAATGVGKIQPLVQPTPSAENPNPAPVERPDPSAGPLSAAANLLPAPNVDGGPSGSQSPVQEAARATLINGAPEPAQAGDYQPADLQTAVAQQMFRTEIDENNPGALRFFHRDADLQSWVEVPEREALAAAQAHIQDAERQGFDPMDGRDLGQLLPEVDQDPGPQGTGMAADDLTPYERNQLRALGVTDEQLASMTTREARQLPLPTVDIDSGPQVVEEAGESLPLPTVEMDSGPQQVEQVQAAPMADDSGYEYRVQKNGRPFKGESDVRLRQAFKEAVAAGEQPVVVQREGGWAVAVPRAAAGPVAPIGIPDLRQNSSAVDAAGNAVPGKIGNVPPADYVQSGRGMDQQAPTRTFPNVLAAKNAISKSPNPAQLEVVPVGPKQFEIRAKQSAAPGVTDQAPDVAVDAPASQPAAEAVAVAAPEAAPVKKAVTVKPSPSAADKAALPEVLRHPRKLAIAKMMKASGIKKGSQGYEAALARLELEYERQVDDAQAALPFEQFNALNKESPESVNRQAWTQLRTERGIEDAANPLASEETSPQQNIAVAAVAKSPQRQPPASKGRTAPTISSTTQPADVAASGQEKAEWVGFTPDSGTLGIPRAQMPQIKAEHRGAMVNFLNARDVAHAEETIAASELKPTQAEYSTKKVEAAKAFDGGERSILISSDRHVLDGHHQWLAKREAGEDVKVIRLDAPIRQLLDTVAEFPSASVDAASAGPASTPQAARVEDAGEKLGGARKDELRSVRERLDSMDDAAIANSTLSQLWPKDEITRIEDLFHAASYQTVREIIPAKPRVPYKVRAWVEKVKGAREILKHLAQLGADTTVAKMRQFSPGLRPIADKIELLMGVDRAQWGRIGRVSMASGRYSEGGTMVPGSWVEVEVDGRKKHFFGKNSVAEAMGDIRAVINLNSAPESRMKFAIYTDRRSGEVFIAKDGDKEQRRLKTFGKVAEARKFVADNHADLVTAWDAVKNRDNVTKADMRRDTNEDRAGRDYRNGADITPEQFIEAFGFRGVEFGNWVAQGSGGADRQGMLNQAYDAFMDLADVVGVPPKALSLEGRLGVGFGSRGRGRASAHFEPGNVVINLTKTKGAGSLAHEWFHALDNYFARQRGGEVPMERGFNAQQAYRNNNFITYRPEPLYIHKTKQSKPVSLDKLRRYHEQNPTAEYYNPANWQVDPRHPAGVRPEVERAFAELVEVLDQSPMSRRSAALDKNPDAYWSQIIERGARAFETYVIAKLADQGYRNDYLANVRSLEEFARAADRYPYLTPDEQGPVSEAFDKLFSTIEARQEQDGRVGLYRLNADTQAAYEQRIDDLFAGAEPNNTAGVRVLDRSDVLDLLGYGDREVVLAEKHAVSDGRFNHPQFTAADWKKVPEWLENPVAVFERDDGNLTVVAPETKGGNPILIAINPGASRPGYAGGKKLHVLLTAYDRDRGRFPAERMIRDGQLRYIDTRKSPAFNDSSRLRLPSNVVELRGLGKKVYTGADLFKYRSASSATDGQRLRVNPGKAKGIPLFSARAIAAKIGQATGLRVEPVADEAGLPAAVRAQIRRDGVSGRVAGVYHDGTSYLIASNLRDSQHAISVVLHEAVGHGGVKVVLGDKLGIAMRGIYRGMPAAMRTELERRYAGQLAGLKSDSEREVLIAEEYVAHLAEHDPSNSALDRIVALVKQFIRKLFGEQAAGKWSRADVVQLLAEAKRAAGSQGVSDRGSRYRAAEAADAPAALPEVAEADEAEFVASLAGDSGHRAFAGAIYKARGTESPFFQRWFGKSRMVDKQGQPIAFVHRSYGERDSFSDADLGKNTGTPTAALGHYLARRDVGNVERYGPVTEQFYIRMEKPKVISQQQFEAMGDWSLAQVEAYRKTLMERGHDGLYIQGLGWAVVFEGKNIKARRNSGTFDETARTRYAATESLIEKQFADTEKAIGGRATWQQAKDAGRTKLEYRQWVQVRTPAFKAWFGDWENGTEQGGAGVAGSAQERGSPGGSTGSAAATTTGVSGNAKPQRRPDSGVRRLDGRGRVDSAGRGVEASGREAAGQVERDWRLDPQTGEPAVFHHGTRDHFTAFDLDHPNRKDKGWLGRGVYLASDRRLADAYAKLKQGSGQPQVMDLFVNVRNPAVATLAHKQVLRRASQEYIDAETAALIARGHDGVVMELPDGTLELMAFDPADVKSATDNAGDFDPASADIRYSLAQDAADLFNRFGRRPADVNDPFAEENRRLREQDKTLWGKAKQQFRRQFAPGGLLPDSVFAEKIARDSEFQAVEFDVRHLSGGLNKAVKTDYGVDIDNLTAEQMKPLAEALTGKVDPAIPEATRVAIVAMRQYIDSLSGEYLSILQKQVEANMEGADQALIDKITGNLGAYVNRSYQAFDDPKWFKRVPTEVVNAARTYLAKGYIEQGETPAEAARLADVTVNEMLKTGTAYDSMGAFIAEGKLGAKDLTVLIKRKEIAPEIRALLGEYLDPRLNFAKSATKMGRLVWNQRFLDRVLSFGMGTFLFEGKDRPADATTQIAGEQSETYAPLNGLWTYPEVAQAFQDALGKEQMSDLYRTVVRLNGMVKYGKTILSPTTAMRNWQSAMFFSLANGHFDLTQMKKSWSAFREQVTQNASGDDLAYLRKLKQLGVVYDTPYAGEMMALLADARMDELLSSKSGTGLKWLRKANQFAQGFYSFGDDFWKIIGFENEKASLIKAGIPETEAETMAAERIRNTYPTYSMIGKAVQWLRRFPLVGTFVSFPSEIIRTTVNMMKLTADDLKSDNPGIRAIGRKRAAGMAMVSAGFYALSALTAAALGVGDDEEEALRDLSAPWSKNSTFLYTGRDADGKLRYFDMSFLDPYGYWKRPLTAMLRDQPWEDAAVSGLNDMLSPFFGADITAGAIFEVMANKKPTGGQVYNEHAGSVDQLQDIANHMRKALQPGFVSNGERLWLAGTEARREGGGQPYDMRDELVSLLGWRAATLDTQTGLYYRSFDFTDALADARKTLTRTLRSSNDVSEGDIRESKQAANAQYQQAFTEMGRLVGAAGAAGMSRQEIMQTLKLSGVAQRNIVALLNGRVPAMDIGMQAQAKAVQQARVMRDTEHAAEIARRFRLAREQ